MQLTPIAAGVRAVYASGMEGFTANLAVVHGPRGVTVFDSGPGQHIGDRLRCSLGEHSAKVLVVINSRSHPENVLGNSSFVRSSGKAMRPAILSTTKTRELMAVRCAACRQRFSDALGPRYAPLTQVILPDRTLDSRHWLYPGGRQLLWLPFKSGQIPGNAALFDVASKTLFASGLVTSRAVPEMADADTEGWLRALSVLAKLNPRFVVPERGVAQGAGAISETVTYLEAVRADAAAALAQGIDLSEIEVAFPRPEYQGWTGYAEHHGKNLRLELLRQERALLQSR